MTTEQPVQSGDRTLEVYERRAQEWVTKRGPGAYESARIREQSEPDPLLVDLGCGPGWHLEALGRSTVGIDAAAAMLEIARARGLDNPLVRADINKLPFRSHSVDGSWAARSYVHISRPDVPMALADLHRVLTPGSPAGFVLFEGDQEHGEFENDEFQGRRFSLWPRPLLEAVFEGAGFAIEEMQTRKTRRGAAEYVIYSSRERSIPDTVDASMRVLICGLNPSLYAADAGIGFARPGNRFWPAALAAGLVSIDRDPRHALTHHGVGMTDLAKRATRTAVELTPSEYEKGVDRLDTMVAWLKPEIVCFVGLAGWRSAVDASAVAGLQERTMAGRPVYLMPSTSGLNAHETLGTLTDHLQAASRLATKATHP